MSASFSALGGQRLTVTIDVAQELSVQERRNLLSALLMDTAVCPGQVTMGRAEQKRVLAAINKFAGWP